MIAVGDDDQNIFEFRGSDSQYMYRLSKINGGRLIEMTDNFRSSKHIIAAANDFAKGITHRLKTLPCIAVSNEDGRVEVVEHPAIGNNRQQLYMFEPVADEITNRRRTGSCCILTQTNEEAVTVLAMLHKRGIKGQLVQSMDGMRFWNLAEARYFIRYINKNMKSGVSPAITDRLWEEAKSRTFDKYAESKSLVYLKRCIQTFEETNMNRYFSDLRDFMFESDVEDFCDLTHAEVVVSTIHKAKGKEFDNVIMLVKSPQHPTDDILRRYYVAMTRARHSLYIHTDGKLFNDIRADRHIIDRKEFAMPADIILQMSHKDVNLNFFASHKQEILSLRSGAPLFYHDHLFSNPDTGHDIAMMSQKMQDKLKLWKGKGYKVVSAGIRFIVAWKPKGAARDEKESAVILIDLCINTLLILM